MKLSVVMPVYNEASTILDILRRVQATPFDKEIVIVDDGSSDGTADILATISDPSVRVIRQQPNQGKGAAIRAGFQAVTGDFVIIQDADLEYDPADYSRLLEPLLDGSADVVYGSRFLGSTRRVLFFWHMVANKLLTLCSNMTTNLNLSDMETGYKAFRVEVVRRLNLQSQRFGIEPEITAKIARLGCRVYEVPISYHGRTYAEGKKIGWRDGFRAIGAILRFGILPNDASTHSGYDTLSTTGGLDSYNAWLWQLLSPYVGKSVFEAGCGTGTITRYLARRTRVLAVDFDHHYVTALQERYRDRSNVKIQWMDLAAKEWPDFSGERFDTIICTNVLEHLPDDGQVLRRFFQLLQPGGQLVLLVPAHQALFGALDEALGHFRRYGQASLSDLLVKHGFVPEQLRYVNPTGAAGWLMNSRLLQRRTMPPLQAALYDRVYPLLRLVDHLGLPVGLSLLAVARKPNVPAGWAHRSSAERSEPTTPNDAKVRLGDGWVPEAVAGRAASAEGRDEAG